MDLLDVDWPVFGLDDDVRPALKDLLAASGPAVLATLFAADGGSPRGVGTQMLFGRNLVTGYLSGGCVEADVALHAAGVMADGEARRLVYGRGGPADVRLPCGGRIEVLLERIGERDPAAARLIALHEARIPALWLTDGAVHACLAPGEGPDGLPPGLQAAFRAALAGRMCGTASGESVFRRFDPSGRLIVVGADPPALAMAALGAQAGFQTTLVRPKGPLQPPPVPGVRYLRTEPGEALAEVGLDPWTSVAVATHDAELDQAALAAALTSQAGYVGVLGSRRRLPERLDQLREGGVSDLDLERLKAPIGLPLSGKSPWEIAISVIGEIVQTARTREDAQAWPAPTPSDAGLELHALVFAAGQGVRYGGAKLLADWNGEAVLHGALAAAFAAPARTVTLVTGAHAADVAAAARAFVLGRADAARLRIVHAEGHAQGLSASIRRGVAALPPGADGAYLFLGDMPRVPASVLGPMAEALAAGALAAAPAFAGRRGHPVLVSAALFEPLQRLAGDAGAGDLLKTLGSALALVEAPDDGVHFDIDAPADLIAAHSHALARP